MTLIYPIVTVIFIYIVNVQCIERYKEYKHFKYYEVTGSSGALDHLSSLMKEKDETLVYSNNRKTSQIIIAPELNDAFRKIVVEEKLNVTLLHDDISQVLRNEKSSRRYNKKFSWDAYYDVNDIYSYLAGVSRSYPKWTEVIVGGKSYDGRDIRGLRINTPDHGDYNPPKPVFFIESGIHAREWIAPATTTYFINQLLTSSDPNVTRLREQFDWRIFPTVNPDGYHYSYVVDRYWRKTRSRSKNGCMGADPNRNWDYNWGQHSSSHKPCDYQTYAGTKPFSEIETRTLSSYISKIDNLLFYVAFHSYAALLLVPYSDSTNHVDNYNDLVQIGKVSLEYGYNVNKEQYDGPGTAAETLYKASGGSMDWVRFSLNTPLVYTYELRGSSFHWPPSRITEQGDEVTQMILGLSKEIYSYLAGVSRSYPKWTEVIVGGKSYEGRDTPDRGDDNPPKPVFFIESGIHAREWIAPATTTYFINQLLTSSDPNVTRLRDQFDWRIFPTVNPDGYHYSYVVDRYWRKTRSRSKNGCRGADPNRNWDYNWGQHSSSLKPCDYQTYAGTKPFSEIETRTLSSYISKIDNLLFYVAFHSYAALLLVPYSDSTNHVENYNDLVQIGKVSLEYGYNVNKEQYDGSGTAAETLYKASGGSMDWVRFSLNTPLVYTYELRGSSFHWPPSRITEQGDEVTHMILGLSKEARNLGYY